MYKKRKVFTLALTLICLCGTISIPVNAKEKTGELWKVKWLLRLLPFYYFYFVCLQLHIMLREKLTNLLTIIILITAPVWIIKLKIIMASRDMKGLGRYCIVKIHSHNMSNCLKNLTARIISDILKHMTYCCNMWDFIQMGILLFPVTGLYLKKN